MESAECKSSCVKCWETASFGIWQTLTTLSFFSILRVLSSMTFVGPRESSERELRDALFAPTYHGLFPRHYITQRGGCRRFDPVKGRQSMKRALLTCVVLFLALSSTGCTHRNLARNGCSSCQSGCQGGCPDGACRGMAMGGCRNGNCGPAGGGIMGGGMFAGGGMGGHMAGGPGGEGGPCRTCGRTPTKGPGGGICAYQPWQHYSDGGMPGPSTAQVAYPYYTTRGPRDFLLNNPPNIGR